MGTEKRERQRQARQEKIQDLRKSQQRQSFKSRGLMIGGIVAAVIVGALIFSIVTSNSSDDSDVATDDGADGDPIDPADDPTITAPPVDLDGVVWDGPAPCPEADGSSERSVSFAEPPPMCIDTDASYTATMVTDVGTIEIELFADQAPVTVNSFVFLARYGYFDGLTFHRVIPDFVLQGGDPQGTGTGGPGYQIDDELPEPEDYQAGSLAMANSGPDTNGSQFFIVTSRAGAETLVNAVGGVAAYSLFGQVIDGMDIVAAIEADGTPGGTPTTTHIIESVTITEN